MPSIRGKSLKALTYDITEGYVTVNPIFLKSFEPKYLRDFYKEISITQIVIRGEKFPTNDIPAIRTRNLKLQRLFSALMIIKNYAKERKIPLI